MEKPDGIKPRLKPTGKKAPAAKNEKSQRERFIETAREIGADETGKVFEEAARRMLRPK